MTRSRFSRVEAVAQQYGIWMVIFARFFVVLRQLNGLVAGTTGMHWANFILANSIGAVLWVRLWTTIAYVFGETAAKSVLPWVWHHLALASGILTVVIILVLLVTVRKCRGTQYSKNSENDKKSD